MKKVRWYKLIYIIFFILIAFMEEESNVIYENRNLVLIMIFIITVFSKFYSLPFYNEKYGVKEYFIDTIESLLIFVSVGMFVSINIPEISNSIIFETIMFILIGYFDFIIGKFFYHVEYNMDRINMYTILAVVYVLGEVGTSTIGDFTSIRNSLAFIVFIDLFVSIIIKRFLFNDEVKRKSHAKSNTEDLYKSLAPTDEIENSEYFKIIDFGIKKDNVNNMAITSIYGGGKSSIIDSYLLQYDHPEVIKVSLANFEKTVENIPAKVKNSTQNQNKPESIDTSVIEKNKIKEDALQLKIIKHLFYKVDPRRLPKSIYVKDYITRCNAFGALIFFIVLYLIIYILGNTILSGLYTISDSDWLMHLIPLLLTITYLLLKSNGIKIKKIETSGLKFEVKQNETIGTFDKYIDELVYFFTITKYRILVIEDVDRYNSIHIFNSLRELNILLNDCETIKEKITFIYALNDHLLEEENIKNNKSKFFDLVIPVIPYSSKYNSDGIITSIFTNVLLDIKNLSGKVVKNVDVSPSEKFVLPLSAYVYDMRTIKNIFNEYIVTLLEFSNRQGLDINNIKNKTYLDKLLAMIVYKNYLPLDYTDLYDERGIFFNLIENKHLFYDDKSSILEKKINNLEKELNYLDEYTFSDKLENNLIWHHFVQEYGGNIHISVYNKDKTESKSYYVKQNFDFKKILSGNSFRLTTSNTLIDFDSKYKTVFKLNNERISITSKKRADIQKELYELKKKLSKVKYMTLSELIESSTKVDINTKYSEIVLKKLEEDTKTKTGQGKVIEVPEILIFLLKSGKLSEDYSIYMNYYKEGNITSNDRIFIQSFYSKEPVKPELVLSGIENIIPLIDSNVIKDRNLLNYSFIDYLIKIDNNQLLQSIFEDKKKKVLFDFFKEYLNQTENNKLLTRYLLKRQSQLLNDMFKEFDKDDFLIDLLVNSVLEYNILSDLDKILNEETLHKINSFDRILIYHNSIVDNLVVDNYNNNLKLINLKLNNITESSDSNKLLDFVLRNGLFELNPEMILVMLNSGFTREIEISFTSIKNNELLFNRVNEDINKFMVNVYLCQIVNENGDSIVDLLNNTELLEENKMKLINSSNISFIIKDLSDIKNTELYVVLMKNERLSTSFENHKKLINFIEDSTEDSTLLEYLSYLYQIVTDKDEIQFTDIETYLIKLLAIDNVDYKKLSKLLEHTEFDKNIYKKIDKKYVAKLYELDILNTEDLDKIFTVKASLEIIEIASFNDDNLKFELFNKYLDTHDYNTEFSEYVLTNKNLKYKNGLIKKYYSRLDESELFKLIPDNIRIPLKNSKQPIINVDTDDYWLIEIGCKLGWYNINKKAENEVRLYPKKNKISNL